MSVAVVVGSGLGGLAAAVRLRAMGWRVVVLEALDQPGGRARVFHRDGYTFDAGPTVITAPHLVTSCSRCSDAMRATISRSFPSIRSTA